MKITDLEAIEKHLSKIRIESCLIVNSKGDLLSEIKHYFDEDGNELVTVGNLVKKTATIFYPYRLWDPSHLKNHKILRNYSDGMSLQDFKDLGIEISEIIVTSKVLTAPEPMKKVPENYSHICPYCDYHHHVDEGCSEMYEDGRCEIGCASCGKIYYYQSKIAVKVENVDTENLPACPFCKGKVTYTECDRDIRQSDVVRCIGDCFFEIDADYEKGKALEWYLKAFG